MQIDGAWMVYAHRPFTSNGASDDLSAKCESKELLSFFKPFSDDFV